MVVAFPVPTCSLWLGSNVAAAFATVMGLILSGLMPLCPPKG